MINKVITCFLNTHADPQRGYHWQADVDWLAPLLNTVPRDQLVVLHDCFDELPVENHRVLPGPRLGGLQRWFEMNRYLIGAQDVEYAWLVDATDVRQLNDPFPHMAPNTLYTGWECQIVGCQWMRDHSPTLGAWIDDNQQRMLLNCGVVGGDRTTLLWLTGAMVAGIDELGDPLEEMALFNMIAYDHPHLVTGPQVTHLFENWTQSHPDSFFQHK